MHVNPKSLRDAAALAAQVAILWLISAAAREAAALLPVRVPPGVLGLGALYVLLAAGWLPVAWIERGAALLVRHLGLFLVPFGVGFIAFGAQLRASGLALAAVLVASTLAGMAITALLCGLGIRVARLTGTPARRISHE